VSFDVMGRLEERGVPFVVAVNSFPDAPRYPLADLRTALDLSKDVTIMECDVRRRASSRDVLMTLMRFLHSLAMTRSLTLSRPATPRPLAFPQSAERPQ